MIWAVRGKFDLNLPVRQDIDKELITIQHRANHYLISIDERGKRSDSRKDIADVLIVEHNVR